MSETKKENTTANQIVEGVLGASSGLIAGFIVYKLGIAFRQMTIIQMHNQRTQSFFRHMQARNIEGMTKSQLIDDIIKNLEILVSPGDPVYEWLQVYSNRTNLTINLKDLNIEQLLAMDLSIIFAPTPPGNLITGEITTYKIGEKLKQITLNGSNVGREQGLELVTIGTAPNSPLREEVDIEEIFSEDQPLLNAFIGST